MSTNTNFTLNNFANAFKTLCNYFYAYRVDSIYKNVNGHHIGGFKSKNAYKILSNHSSIELKVGCFKEYFLKLLSEILKYPSDDLKLFFFTSTTSFIRDFVDFDDALFGGLETSLTKMINLY